MTVIKIHGDHDWNRELENAGGKLVVADFSATWCGPCQHMKPIYEQFSRQYPDVVFLEVDEGQNRSLVGILGITGFPTFHFYIRRSKVDQVVGADQSSLCNKIEQWRQSAHNPFASPGVSLGGQMNANEDPREARLRRLGRLGIEETMDIKASQAGNVSREGDMVCDENGSCRLLPEDNKANKKRGSIYVNEELMVPLQDMGFSETRSRKALLATNSKSLEDAVLWIGEHQDDADIDEPISDTAYAEADRKSTLTPEEKAAKLAELEIKIQQRRFERQETEKREAIESEIKRRTLGKKMQQSMEDYDAMQRKLAAEKMKREREEAKRERERLKKQIEQDKLERRIRGGKLGGAPIDLPSIETKAEPAPSTVVQKESTPKEQIILSIDKLKQYRVGNDGLTALKTLDVYLKNVLEKPEDEKYRAIKLDNAAFRKRVAALVGGISLLKAVGFEKDDAENVLKLDASTKDEDLIRFAKRQIEAAIVSFA